MTERKIDWMYKGISGLVDSEDYLTGRKVDKTFEMVQKEEKGGSLGDQADQSLPSSLFGIPSSSSAGATVDLANKIREDPLFEMRKKQLEESKKILDNPIRMKRLKALIESTLESEDSSSKKKKRRKKHKHSRAESSSDDEKKDDRHRRRHHHHRKSKKHKKQSSDSSEQDRRSRSRHRS